MPCASNEPVRALRWVLEVLSKCYRSCEGETRCATLTMAADPPAGLEGTQAHAIGSAMIVEAIKPDYATRRPCILRLEYASVVLRNCCPVSDAQACSPASIP